MTPPNSKATAARSRWQRINTWAGGLVFGVPVAAMVPALVATALEFGLFTLLVTGGLAAAVACAPLLLWVRYCRRPPSSRTGKVAWVVVAAMGIVTLLFSPLFFWAGPALLVLLAEVSRVLTHRRFTAIASAIRTSSHTSIRRRSK